MTIFKVFKLLLLVNSIDVIIMSRKKINCHKRAHLVTKEENFKTSIPVEIEVEKDRDGWVVGVGCPVSYIDNYGVRRCPLTDEEKSEVSYKSDVEEEQVQDGYCVHRIADELE